MAHVPLECPDNPVRRGLFQVMRERIRAFHYSRRTEKAYLHWARRFVQFHGRRSPRELGAADVTGFLSTLATRDGVAAATQNQALAAILFLYRRVLELDMPWLTEVVRAKRPVRLPTVLTVGEVDSLLGCMKGETALMARLMYGSGLRIGECVALRVKDVDLGRREVLSLIHI